MRIRVCRVILGDSLINSEGEQKSWSVYISNKCLLTSYVRFIYIINKLQFCFLFLFLFLYTFSRSQCPSGLRRGSTDACLLGLWVRLMLGPCVFVLSGRGLCDGPIPCPEESYRLSCVTMCDLETSNKKRPCPALGC